MNTLGECWPLRVTPICPTASGAGKRGKVEEEAAGKLFGRLPRFRFLEFPQDPPPQPRDELLYHLLVRLGHPKCCLGNKAPTLHLYPARVWV